MKVTKAKEFEGYRTLPKFDHVSMAVIHPSPTKKRAPYAPPTPDLTIGSRTAKMTERDTQRKQLPEHLIRPSLDTSSTEVAMDKKMRKSQASASPGKGNKGKKRSKVEEERFKVKRAEKN